MAERDVYKIPPNVRLRVLKRDEYSHLEREEFYHKFVDGFLKLNSQDPENFSRTMIHLEKLPNKAVHKRIQDITIKKLTYRKRKELGLFTIGRKSLKYRDLLPLHKLWKDYMRQYIKLHDLKLQNLSNKEDEPNFEHISLKLYRADYHGAKMKVIKSICPSYIGKAGIVIMETKNCFKLLGCDNEVRTIPKNSCLFMFKIDEFEFTFYGKNLQIKPAERSSKKVKTIYVSDLQL